MITSIETVLVVDDDLLMREFVVETLHRQGIHIVQAGNGEQARKLMEERDFDMAFVDIKMPGLSGMDLLRWMQESRIPTLTVMVTAFGTVEQAVEAMKLGAVDFLMKPFSPEQVEVVLDRAREWVKLKAQNDYLKEELGWKLPHGRQMLGQSVEMVKLLDQIERVANSSSSVLVSGESGTGKELVAQAIHSLSNRRAQPYVRMNCAAVPESLADSELFGHEKGAFTSAINRRLGRFELAGGGTLLLDEISEMPMNLQAKLLRVIQEREFERVGGTRTLRADCRIIATTNRNLEEYVREGGFRQDLYYRLNVVPLHIPPLRHRVADIPLLAQTFLKAHLHASANKPAKLYFTNEMITQLCNYSWPGNIRELEHLVERLCVMEKGPALTPDVLPAEIRNTPPSASTDTKDDRNPSNTDRPPAQLPATGSQGQSQNLDTIERIAIFEALKATDGQRNQAAELLGVSIRTLRNKLNRYKEESTLPAEFA